MVLRRDCQDAGISLLFLSHSTNHLAALLLSMVAHVLDGHALLTVASLIAGMREDQNFL